MIREVLAVTGWVVLPLVALLALRFVYFLGARALGRTLGDDAEIAARTEEALFGQAIKQAFGAAVEPVVRLVERLGVHPHLLTLACLLLSFVAAAALAAGDLLAGGLIAALASIFDYFDGRVARRTGRSSLAGNFLDSTLDRVSELALFGGAAILFRESAFLLLVTLLASGGAILTSYARAKAESLGLMLKSGWLQRPERVTLLCAGAAFDPLATTLPWPAVLGPHPLFAAATCVLAALGVITTLQRLWGGYRAAESRSKNAR